MKLRLVPRPGRIKLLSSSKVGRWRSVANRMLVLPLMTVGFFALDASAADDNAKSGLDMQRLGKIHQRMQEFVSSRQAAGIVTLVQQNGKVVEIDAVGMQNVEENKAMRQDSIFQIMSMTKPLTAVGIMMLAEDGKISLYDNVETYLP